MSVARALAIVALAGCAPKFAAEPKLVPGGFTAARAPDGNSVIFDAPNGLVVVDTGRHVDHQDELLRYADAHRKRIAAIVNTHWHLDHTGGNAKLRAAYPRAEVVATRAVEGALVGFFPNSVTQTEQMIAQGKVSSQQLADFILDRAAIDAPDALRPTHPITASGPVTLAGRTFDVHVAPFAATEADLWLYDPASKTVVAGDLVVAEVPFFDTGCPSGWRRALGEIAATPFVWLVPGHGAIMTREQFTTWRAAFDALLDCAASPADDMTCIAGWREQAAEFIPPDDADRVDRYVAYYVTQILRSPEAHARFCRPLR